MHNQGSFALSQCASFIPTLAARMWPSITARNVLCTAPAQPPANVIVLSITGSRETCLPVRDARSAPSPAAAPTASLASGVAGVDWR